MLVPNKGVCHSFVVACGCWLILPSRVVVASNGSNYTTKVTTTNTSLAELEACREECPGLREFDERMNEALKTAGNSAGVCRAAQVDSNVIKCVLGLPVVCSMYQEDFTKTKSICHAIGIEITQEATKTAFTAIGCMMCSRDEGASDIKVYWPSLGVKTLTECEEICILDAACAAFDYDATRSMCRVWSSCGKDQRSDRFGCQWTIYEKPGFISASLASTGAPSASTLSVSSVEKSAKQDSNTTQQPTQPRDVGVTSTAVPCRCLFTSWLAIAILAILAMHGR